MGKMSKKLEEKIDTQVINLQEIKEVASTEKKERKQKSTPLLLLFLGLFMIVMGILYPIIMSTLEDESVVPSSSNSSTEETPKPVTNTTIACTKTVTDQNSSSIYNNVYTFDAETEGLISFSNSVEVNAISDEAKLQNGLLAQNFSATYGQVNANGVTSNVSLTEDQSQLKTAFVINYNVFDLENYNLEHTEQPLILDVSKGMKKEEVRTAITNQGYTCQ